MRGASPFTGPECQSLSKLIEEMKSLMEDALPYQISFKNPVAIKQLLDMRRRGLRYIPVPLGPRHLVEEFENESQAGQ
jgi:hypothetical protein